MRSKSRTKDKVCPLKDDSGNIVVEDEAVCNVLSILALYILRRILIVV